MTKNRYGLRRDIPEKVRREVRQRDGFGCIFCGCAIVQYDHFDPDYKDATEHRASGITLLCNSHHGLKNTGMLSLETIKRQISSPAALRAGARGPFDIGVEYPEILLGTIKFIRTEILLESSGEQILSIAPPEQPGGPFRISALLKSEDGSIMLSIVENEWRAGNQLWDVDVEGARIKIRQAPRDLAIVLRADPPRGLVFERLKLRHKDVSIECHERNGVIVRRDSATSMRFGDSIKVENAGVGLSIPEDRDAILVGLPKKRWIASPFWVFSNERVTISY